LDFPAGGTWHLEGLKTQDGFQATLQHLTPLCLSMLPRRWWAAYQLVPLDDAVALCEVAIR
jgi:hypothetical protein